MTPLTVMLDAAPSAVVAVDEHGVIRYANDRVAEVFGYAAAELLGEQVEILAPPDRASGYARLREQYTADPTPFPMGSGIELVARRKDGSEFAVEVSLTTMPAGEGPAGAGEIWIVAGIADISERIESERHIQAVSRAYLTLAQINQAIIRARDVETLFQETCRVSVEQGGYLGAYVGVPGDGSSVRVAATAGVLDDYIGRLRLSVDERDARGRGPTARTFREGKPYFSSDFLTDPATRPWQRDAAEHGIRASATLPLRCEGEVVAVLAIYSDRPGVFDAHMRELLAQVSENVSFALDGFAAGRRLREVAAQRSELLRRLVTAQESERSRIAADIHDDSVQALAAIDLRLGLLQEQLRAAAPDLLPTLAQVQRTLANASAGLRELLFNLEPQGSATTCADAVREAAQHIFERTPIHWEVRCDDDIHLGDPEQMQALRIVKEAMLNARNHSEADRVDVIVSSRDDGLQVEVTDDGIGLDPENPVRRAGHRGLQTMRDRAEVSGGWCRLERGPGERGTTVRFWIPRSGRGAQSFSG